MKFCAIVSSNLDEFFMVRVAIALRTQASGKESTGPDSLTVTEMLQKISTKVHELVERQQKCFEKELLPRLKKEGIDFVRMEDYGRNDKKFLKTYFADKVLPVLTPLAVDPSHPFPLLSNCGIYILFSVSKEKKEAEAFYGKAEKILVQVPPSLDRFVQLPSKDGKLRIALLDDMIKIFATKLIPGYKVEEAVGCKVTRDADLSVDEEQSENLMSSIEQELQSRRRGAPVRLEIERSARKETVGYLCEMLELSNDEVYFIPTILGLKNLFQFISMIDRKDMEDKPWPPVKHPLIDSAKGSIFSKIRQRDILLHHPYHSFEPIIKLVGKAAQDKKVLAIKITLYRVSGDSPIVKSLIAAAQNGKQVTALVELRARFDEEANIHWAKQLDKAGAHVIYGVMGYKTHSKALLVVRKEQGGIRRYVHLSTGNYNDSTAKLYTDLGYLTARPDFGADISAFFNVITGYSLPAVWKQIEMAPTGLREKVLFLIEREIEKHSPETPGLIRIKCNSFIDPTVINALYNASGKGVKVELVIRGLCRLRPGVKGLSENITVRSIVDRFLEHPRIYHFHNGGAEEIYLSSADMMERNLDNRVELFFPIVDKVAIEEAKTVLDMALVDNQKAWDLKDITYKRVRNNRKKPFRSQERLYLRAVNQANEYNSKVKKNKQKGMFIANESPENSNI
jgi:polyphosphate kinase